MPIIKTNKRRSDGPVGGTTAGPHAKRGKGDFQNDKGNPKAGIGRTGWNATRKVGPSDPRKNSDKPQFKQRNRKHLSAIVTEAKANYQLYSDKKIDSKEKQILMKSTYDLVKDYVPELARMKGMGKVIGSLINSSNSKRKELAHVQSFYKTPEDKLLLMKGNGYRLAIKIIQNSNGKIVQEYVDACLSNGKGLRALFENFKPARAMFATYACGSNAAKKIILQKIALGNMPLGPGDSKTPLQEIFASSKPDVIEGCKKFLSDNLNKKSLEQELIQDLMLLCIETHQTTGMDVEEFLKMASENILPLCRRLTKCTLPLWVVWLSNAQMRKQIMKTLKGKVVPLLQTYNGLMFMMALFESTDDTKAMNKMIMKDVLDSVNDLIQQTEVRKLLEFLMIPRSTKFMHPQDIEILKKGDAIRTSKKSTDVRFTEIRDYMKEPVLGALKANCQDWLKDNKLCLFVIATVERFGDFLSEELLEEISSTLTSDEFSERIHQKAIRMLLETMISADVRRIEKKEGSPVFMNFFIPALENTHADACVEKSTSIVYLFLENAKKIKRALTFDLAESWLCSKRVSAAIKKMDMQKISTKLGVIRLAK